MSSSTKTVKHSSSEIACQQQQPSTSRGNPNNVYAISEPGRQQQHQTNKQRFGQYVDHYLIRQLCFVASTNEDTGKNLTEKELQHIFAHLGQIINDEYPPNKREEALGVLHNAGAIYLHLLYLRNKCEPRNRLPASIKQVLDALHQSTMFSHDQYYGPVRALENRKLQISLGMVEALTSLFVLDIEMFGLQLDGYEKCSKLRRSIGNTLMNLVYQQREAKLKLCSNLLFLRRVADVIGQVYPLVQYYAGLIQNVSYNADCRIAHHLAITVPPLVQTAISIAYEQQQQQRSEDGNGRQQAFDLSALDSGRKQDLLKILSALWNLAEDPVENKRVMCHDVPQFVPLLLKIMCSDAQRELQFIQAATGIMKHLCNHILSYPVLFERTLRKGAIQSFMRQLVSSSPDLVTDALNAMSILAKHPAVAQEIRTAQDGMYIQQISYLVNNTIESISRASRTLLDTVYSASVYYQLQQQQQQSVQQQQQPQSEMCASMFGWPASSSSKQQRASADDQYGHGGTHQQNAVPLNVHHQQHPAYCTLPRRSNQNQPTTRSSRQEEYAQHHQQQFQQFQRYTAGGGYQNITPNHQQQLIQQVLTVANNPQQWQQFDEEEEKGHIGNNHEQQFVVKLDDFVSAEQDDEEEEDLQDLPTSVRCTRDVSPKSSTSSGDSVNADGGKMNQGEEWPSIQSTSVHSSSVQSTASASELPDSPSQCAEHNHKMFQLREMEMQIIKMLNENQHSGGQCTNADVSGDTDGHAAAQEAANGGVNGDGCLEEEADEKNTAAEEQQQQREDIEGEEAKRNEAAFASVARQRSGGDSLLAEAIRSYMPKPAAPAPQLLQLMNHHHKHQQHHQIAPPPLPPFVFTQSSTPILTPVSCNSPCKSPAGRNEAVRTTAASAMKSHFVPPAVWPNKNLLEESITAVMPAPPAPPIATSINSQCKSRRLFGGWSRSSRNSSGGTVEGGTMGMSPSRRQHNNSEDDDFLLAPLDVDDRNGNNFSKIPCDVAKEIDAQWITVDCQKISPAYSSSTQSQQQQQTGGGGSKATSNGGSNSSGRNSKCSQRQKATLSSSHIPILLSSTPQKGGGGKAGEFAQQQPNGASPAESTTPSKKAGKIKSSASSSLMNSPQKLPKAHNQQKMIASPRKKKPPPPPLAPKPKLPLPAVPAAVQKQKCVPEANAAGRELPMEEKSDQPEIMMMMQKSADGAENGGNGDNSGKEE